MAFQGCLDLGTRGRPRSKMLYDRCPNSSSLVEIVSKGYAPIFALAAIRRELDRGAVM